MDFRFLARVIRTAMRDHDPWHDLPTTIVLNPRVYLFQCKVLRISRTITLSSPF
jgi:hypothetical protein